MNTRSSHLAPSGVTPDHVARYLGHLTDRDLRAALRAALALADEGTPLPDVLDGLIGTAQREVGERWARDELSVADEHAATAISDAVVSVLTAQAPVVPDRGVSVAVVCAEGEWHVLAARLAAEILRAEGHEVELLGGSLPPSHLRRFLASTLVDVLAVSCSTPDTLGGVLSCVQVAHGMGVPVLAGGRAFGGDERRARALGVDLWAPDARTAARLLRQPLPLHLAEPTAQVEIVQDLSSKRQGFVESALAELTTRVPSFRGLSLVQRDEANEELDFLLRHVEVAILTQDPTLLDEHVQWMASVLGARRDVAPELLVLALEVMAGVTAQHEPVSSLLLGALLAL